MTIFISYNWHNTVQVNEIQKKLELAGISVIRDVKDFKYRDALDGFMSKIREADYALVFISEKYLKSFNCMKEALEFQKEIDKDKRILPIIDSKFDITNDDVKISLIDYWGKKVTQLHDRLRKVEPYKSLSLHKKVAFYIRIESDIDGFVDSITSARYLSFEELNSGGYAKLFNYLGLDQNGNDYNEFILLKLAGNGALPEREIQSFINKYPNSALRYLAEAEIADTQKDYIKAYQLNSKALELYYKEGRSKFSKVIFLYSLMQIKTILLGVFGPVELNSDYNLEFTLDDLLDEYLALIDEFPDFSPFYFQLGNIYRTTRQFDYAIDLYEKLEQRKNFSYSLFIDKGKTYYQKNELNNAKNEFEKAIHINSKDEKVYILLGDLYKDQTEYKQAEKMYTIAVNLNPKNTMHLNQRGRLYYENLGRTNDALAQYNFAAEIDPNYSGTYLNRGNLYQGIGMYYEAIEDYKKYIELKPDDYSGYYSLGVTYYLEGKYKQAMQEYTKAINLNNKFHVLMSVRAKAYIKLNLYDDALIDALKVIDLDSANIVGYELCGFIYGLKKDYQNSYKFYEKAVSIDSDNILNRIYRSIALFKLGKITPQTHEDIKYVLKKDPNNKHALALKKKVEYIINNSDFFVNGRKI